jgi:hypothetical protein
MENGKIDSLKKFHQQIPSILEKINAEPLLALAAATNLLYAVEELGYQIIPKVGQELEDLLRFKTETITRLKKLRQKIYEQAKHPFDLNSAAELYRVLEEKLQSHQTDKKIRNKELSEILKQTTPFPPQVGWAAKISDPLEKWREKDPIMEPLLEYRRLEASAPRLANRELYQEIRNGSRSTPVNRIRFIGKRSPHS